MKKKCLRLLTVIFTIGLATAIFPTPGQIRAAELPEERLVPEIKFLYPAPKFQLSLYEAGTMIARNWEKLGIRVNVSLMPSYPIFKGVVMPPKSAFDAGIARLTATPDRLDPEVLLYSQYHSSGGPRSFTGYENPEIDQLLDAQRRELDQGKRRELIYKTQEILHQDIPSIALFHPEEIFIYNKRKWSNFVNMAGQGVANIWTALDAVPLTKDKSLKMGAVTPLENFNPLNVTLAIIAWNYLGYWFDTLTRITPEIEAVPWAAESWKWLDQMTIEVKIRHGMKFHDGKPVTTEDVKFSYDFYKKWSPPLAKDSVKEITAIQIINDQTLIIKLGVPFPPLLFVTFSNVPILPKHIWKDVVTEKNLKHPGDWSGDSKINIGSGPFVFSSWERGRVLRLKRNPDHFHSPKSDQFLYVDYASPESLLFALKKEEVDYHDYRVVMNLSNAEEAEKAEHLAVKFVPTHAVYQMIFNLRRPPFKDRAFREAAVHAIPFKSIVHDILGGHGEPGVSDIAPANKAWHNPDLETYQYDLDLSKKILKDAGYEWDEKGRLYFPQKMVSP